MIGHDQFQSEDRKAWGVEDQTSLERPCDRILSSSNSGQTKKRPTEVEDLIGTRVGETREAQPMAQEINPNAQSRFQRETPETLDHPEF